MNETTTRGMVLPCPLCGNAEAAVKVNLADVSEFTCSECDGEFTREDLETLIAKWSKVLSWLDAAPIAPTE